MTLKHLIFFSLVLGLTLASNSRPFDDASGNKRSRRNNFFDENALVSGIQSIAISQPVIPDFITRDPFLKACHEMIPNMLQRELSGMFEEAVFNENFGLIKVFSFHGKVGELVDSDQIDSLCRSRSEISADILDFLLDQLAPCVDDLIEQNLSNWLNFCVPFGFKKFKLFWEAFNGETSLPIISLAGILTKVSSHETKKFYDFVLQKIYFDSEKFKIILNKAVLNCTMYGNSDKLIFLLENCLSLSILDLQQKIRLVFMATNTNNSFLLRFLLRNKEVLTIVSTMPKSPWMAALKRDLPDVLDVFIKEIPSLRVEALAMTAFSLKKRQILNNFKSKGLLNDEILFKMAVIAIQSKNIHAMEFLGQFGVPVTAFDSNGCSLLTIAVDHDAIDIARFLIKTCGMDPNTINRKYDFYNTITVSTPIHYVKSPEMVHLLADNGADVNMKFERLTHYDIILRSTTALHKAAAESNVAVFGALIDRGADIKISDAVGLTNEAFYYRNFFNYPKIF